MTKDEALKLALEALEYAEAGLADIGDADREPGDDLAWCERRAAQALPKTRETITAIREALAQPKRHINYVCPQCYWTLEEQEPLTDEEIRGLADKHLFYQPESYEVSGVFNLARAIEAKHGIKE